MDLLHEGPGRVGTVGWHGSFNWILEGVDVDERHDFPAAIAF
jgi:hypothetical protein